MSEAERNALLRQVDWRFLLRSPEAPRILDLRSPGDRDIAPLIGATSPGPPTLVLLSRPRIEDLRRAYAALPPGGEVHAVSILPAPVLRHRLATCGFDDVRLYWA